MAEHALPLKSACLAAGMLLSAALAQPPAKAPPVLPPIDANQARLDQTLGGLDGPGFAIAYNGAHGILAAACERGTIRYWNKGETLGLRAGDGTPNRLAGHQGPVTALAWSGSSVLASGGVDHKIILWSMPDGTVLQSLAAGGIIRALATSPDGKLLASGGDDLVVHVWEIATGKARAELTGHTDWVLCLAFSPDGKQLASAGHDGVIQLWEVATGKKLRAIPAKPAPATVAQAKPKPAAGKGPPAMVPLEPPVAVLALGFSPDGKQLAWGGSDGQIRLANSSDGKIVRTLAGHTSAVTALAFHPGGTLLASASKDHTVRLWALASGQAVKVLAGHTAWVQGVTFLAQGTRLASVGADQTVRLWSLTSK